MVSEPSKTGLAFQKLKAVHLEVNVALKELRNGYPRAAKVTLTRVRDYLDKWLAEMQDTPPDNRP